MARRQRSKKTTPLKEVAFLLTIAICFVLVALQTSAHGSATSFLFQAALLLALFGGIVFYVFLVFKQRRKLQELRALEISNVDEMPGVEFEKYVAVLLRHRGYKTKMTAASSDYGVDIIATKNGTKTAVQVKRYSSKLDQKSIREAVAGKSVKSYGCTEAMVVTNSTFTKAARFLASESGCTLVDREILSEWIFGFQNIKKA